MILKGKYISRWRQLYLETKGTPKISPRFFFLTWIKNGISLYWRCDPTHCAKYHSLFPRLLILYHTTYIVTKLILESQIHLDSTFLPETFQRYSSLFSNTLCKLSLRYLHFSISSNIIANSGLVSSYMHFRKFHLWIRSSIRFHDSRWNFAISFVSVIQSTLQSIILMSEFHCLL